MLTPQLPLHVEDRGADWLVKGTPYDDPRRASAHNMFHVFIRKDSAEVTGLDFEARFKFAPKVMAEWRRRLSPADYARVLGPPTRFEPDGIPDMVKALYGGILNKPEDATAYALVLLHTGPMGAAITARDLFAVAEGKVWSVRGHRAGQAHMEVLRLSRETGKLIAGDL